MVYVSPLPSAFEEILRNVNVVLGMIALILLFLLRVRPYWHGWATARRLKTMSLMMLCFSGSYGTFEILYLHTNYRVPMVTISLAWACLACLWKKDYRDSGLETR